MAKQRMSAGDAPIAGEREIESSSHTVTLNRSDGWSREAGDGTHQALTYLREAECFRAVQRRNLVEVGARREEPRIASDHQPRRRMRRKLLDGGGEGFHAGARQAVGAVVRDQTQNDTVATPLARVEGFVEVESTES